MGVYVRSVAIERLKVDGDGAIGAHGEHKQQLLQIGPVVLVVAVADHERSLALQASAGRLGIVPAEGDGGRIVVQRGEVHRKGVHRPHHHLRQQGGTGSGEQGVEGTPNAIIVEQSDFFDAQAEQMRGHPPGPFRLRVQGHPRRQQVAQQDSQGLGRGKLVAAVECCDVFLEQAVDA